MLQAFPVQLCSHFLNVCFLAKGQLVFVAFILKNPIHIHIVVKGQSFGVDFDVLFPVSMFRESVNPVYG